MVTSQSAFYYNPFLQLLAEASHTITARGLALYAADPPKYAQLAALPFPAYIPLLAEELKTPAFLELLSASRLLFGEPSRGLTDLDLETLRQHFYQLIGQAASSQTWFPQEGGHSQRVARIAATLAEQLGYSSPEIHEITWGGLLHDVGKLFVGELFVALEGQGLPSPVTLPFIRAHASLGRSFLESVLPLFPTALTCAALHQESVDGSGYPQGLTYAQLTVESQIVNLADGYDATVTRMGWSAPQVCIDAEQMYARAGHPDALILSTFIYIVNEHHQEWYPTA